jgi:hypothetical protein
MGKLTYSKAILDDHRQSQGLKTTLLAVGTVLNVDRIKQVELDEGETAPRDILICKNAETGVIVRVPIREFVKMQNADGGEIVTGEGDSIEFPSSFKIAAANPRQFEGKDQMPVQAYSAYDAMRKANSFDWDKLFASDLKDNHGMSPVQDYKISLTA